MEDQVLGLVVTALNFEFLGRPSAPPAAAMAGGSPTPRQARCLRRLRAQVRAHLRAVSSVSVTARATRGAQTATAVIASLSAAAAPFADASGYGGEGGLPDGLADLRIRPDDVSLPPPGTTGGFDAAQAMPDGVRSPFLSPLSARVDHPPPPPRARSHVAHDDFPRLLGRMDEAGMVELIDDAEVDGRLVAQLFAVPKVWPAQRLITNRKPGNSQERPLGASRELFPHPCLLGDLRPLEPGEVMVGSGTDLPDFYHTVVCSEERARTNAFGPRLRLVELGDLPAAVRLRARCARAGRAPPEFVRAIQATLPMGDLNATDFAQVAHLGVLRAGGCARPASLVSYRSPAPRGSVGEWVMVDDRVVTSMVPRPAPEERPLGDPLFGEGVRAYEAAGLTTHPGKTFEDQVSFRMLGADVDGEEGWARARVEIPVLACWLAAKVATCSHCPLRGLEAAVALATNQLLYRRPALCVFGTPAAGQRGCYSDIAEARRQGRTSLRPSLVARDELLLAAALAPLLGADLRAPCHDWLVASDACGGERPGVGGATAPLPPGIAPELWRRRLRKGGYTGQLPWRAARGREFLLRHELFPGADAIDEAHVFPRGEAGVEEGRAACADLREQVGAVCDALSWTPTFVHEGARGEHINLNELRGVRTAIRRLLRQGIRRRRVLLVCDSLVASFAVAKGRATSPRLLRLLRTFAPEVLFAGLDVGMLPVPSAQNPSDEVSRWKHIRRGRAPGCRPWALAFVAGDPTAIDATDRADPREAWLLPVGSRLQPSGAGDWRAEP